MLNFTPLHKCTRSLFFFFPISMSHSENFPQKIHVVLHYTFYRKTSSSSNILCYPVCYMIPADDRWKRHWTTGTVAQTPPKWLQSSSNAHCCILLPSPRNSQWSSSFVHHNAMLLKTGSPTHHTYSCIYSCQKCWQWHHARLKVQVIHWQMARGCDRVIKTLNSGPRGSRFESQCSQ